MSKPQEHQHSYSRSVTSTTYGSYTKANGDEGCMKTEYWEDKCACGDTRSSGSTTTEC